MLGSYKSMAQWLRGLDALPEDQDLIPSNHTSVTSLSGDLMPLWVPGTYIVHIHTSRQNTYIPIKIFKVLYYQTIK